MSEVLVLPISILVLYFIVAALNSAIKSFWKHRLFFITLVKNLIQNKDNSSINDNRDDGLSVGQTPNTNLQNDSIKDEIEKLRIENDSLSKKSTMFEEKIINDKKEYEKVKIDYENELKKNEKLEKRLEELEKRLQEIIEQQNRTLL